MLKIAVVCTICVFAVRLSAQEELVISIDEVASGSWEVSAELLNPVNEIETTIANVNISLVGSGFSGFAYNHFAFDSEFFGDATFEISSTEISFRGINTPGPLRNSAGPDMSNPLHLISFDAAGVDEFSLVGQNDGAYLPIGTDVFPTIINYQRADGAQGEVPHRIEINPIPSSGAAAIFVLSGLGISRRRR